MSRQRSDQDRVAEIEVILAGIDARFQQWNRDLEKKRAELVDGGMEYCESLDAVSDIWKNSIESGECPVDFDELNQTLDELCAIYLKSDDGLRIDIRRIFDDRRSLLNHLHSYICRTSRLLEASGDPRWLRLGLAAASIGDMRVDWRDLLIRLGDLYVTARRVGIKRPGRQFRTVAELSNAEGRYCQGSTRDLLVNFRKSAYLESIRGKET
jgi:hypothetical protein